MNWSVRRAASAAATGPIGPPLQQQAAVRSGRRGFRHSRKWACLSHVSAPTTHQRRSRRHRRRRRRGLHLPCLPLRLRGQSRRSWGGWGSRARRPASGRCSRGCLAGGDRRGGGGDSPAQTSRRPPHRTSQLQAGPRGNAAPQLQPCLRTLTGKLGITIEQRRPSLCLLCCTAHPMAMALTSRTRDGSVLRGRAGRGVAGRGAGVGVDGAGGAGGGLGRRGDGRRGRRGAGERRGGAAWGGRGRGAAEGGGLQGGAHAQPACRSQSHTRRTYSTNSMRGRGMGRGCMVTGVSSEQWMGGCVGWISCWDRDPASRLITATRRWFTACTAARHHHAGCAGEQACCKVLSVVHGQQAVATSTALQRAAPLTATQAGGAGRGASGRAGPAAGTGRGAAPHVHGGCHGALAAAGGSRGLGGTTRWLWSSPAARRGQGGGRGRVAAPPLVTRKALEGVTPGQPGAQRRCRSGEGKQGALRGVLRASSSGTEGGTESGPQPRSPCSGPGLQEGGGCTQEESVN